MQRYAYLAVLLVSLGGLSYLDYKRQLALFWNWRIVLKLLAIHVAIFLLWDIVLIHAGIIGTNPAWVSGLYVISPDMPIEEFFFLTLLGYQTMLLWRWRCTRT